jgi:hypothetical protein
MKRHREAKARATVTGRVTKTKQSPGKEKYYFLTATLSRPLGMVGTFGFSQFSSMIGTVTSKRKLNQKLIQTFLNDNARVNGTTRTALGDVVSVTCLELTRDQFMRYQEKELESESISFSEGPLLYPVCRLVTLPRK